MESKSQSHLMTAYALDQEHGNTFWLDAIQQEMSTVRITFRTLDDDEAIYSNLPRDTMSHGLGCENGGLP
jgi:hypothetical protein